MFIFATLTQPKRPRFEESPRDAVRRIVATWRKMTDTKHATGRRFRTMFAGGLRTTETTYAKRGDAQFHGDAAVRFSGYHAHLHVILEVRVGIDRAEAAGWLQRTWLSLCDGSSAAAQCVRPASMEDAAQLCKYVTKPLEDCAERPAILRELFGALHGVRLLQAFGEWMARVGVRPGWRELAPKADDGPQQPRYRGPEIGELLRWSVERLRPIGTTDTVAFVGVHPGDEVHVSAKTAWDAIQTAISDRLRTEREKPPPPG